MLSRDLSMSIWHVIFGQLAFIFFRRLVNTLLMISDLFCTLVTHVWTFVPSPVSVTVGRYDVHWLTDLLKPNSWTIVSPSTISLDIYKHIHVESSKSLCYYFGCKIFQKRWKTLGYHQKVKAVWRKIPRFTCQITVLRLLVHQI